MPKNAIKKPNKVFKNLVDLADQFPNNKRNFNVTINPLSRVKNPSTKIFNGNNMPISEGVDLKKFDNKFLNFAEVPYYKPGADKDTILDLQILNDLKKAKEGTLGDNDLTQRLKGLGSLFDGFQLSQKHINLLKQYYEDNDYEAFETYLAMILYDKNNDTYVRDMIYNMFPEIHEKRLNYIKTNLEYYTDMAKRAVYQIPRTPKDIYSSFLLGEGLTEDVNDPDDIEGKRNKKYDINVMQELLFRKYSDINAYSKMALQNEGRDDINDDYNVRLQGMLFENNRWNKRNGMDKYENKDENGNWKSKHGSLPPFTLTPFHMPHPTTYKKDYSSGANMKHKEDRHHNRRIFTTPWGKENETYNENLYVNKFKRL